MKALSLTQPWATLVALGHKRIETRSWSTRFIGPIAIHAAKGFPSACRLFAEEERAIGRVPAQLPLGAVVAVVTVISCRFTVDVAPQLTPLERRLGDYSPGRYAWFLSDIQALREPVPCKGALGLWNVPADVERQILEAVPA